MFQARGWTAACVVALAAGGVARAEEPGVAAGELVPAPGPSPTAQAKAAKKQKKEHEPLEIHGRVEARVGATDEDSWAREYAIGAILGADFRQGGWLRGQVELEVSVLPSLRDAWIRAELPWNLSARVGRYRPPFGRVEQTSRWDLPVVRRGAISRHAHDELGYGGRRSGITLEHEPSKRLSLELGVFQGEPLEDGSAAEDLVARASGKVATGVSIGGGAYVRGAFRPGQQGRTLFGADARWRHGALEVVGEVVGGDEFQGALALASWRIDLGLRAGWWAQPAVSAELVRVNGATRPLVTPALNAGAGTFRARAALELGSARDMSAERRAALLFLVGAAF